MTTAPIHNHEHLDPLQARAERRRARLERLSDKFEKATDRISGEIETCEVEALPNLALALSRVGRALQRNIALDNLHDEQQLARIQPQKRALALAEQQANDTEAMRRHRGQVRKEQAGKIVERVMKRHATESVLAEIKAEIRAWLSCEEDLDDLAYKPVTDVIAAFCKAHVDDLPDLSGWLDDRWARQAAEIFDELNAPAPVTRPHCTAPVPGPEVPCVR